jgi:hypothetical protein
MKPVLPNGHCELQMNVASIKSHKSLSRRLTDGDVIIDFNAFANVSATFDNSCQSSVLSSEVKIFSEKDLQHNQKHSLPLKVDKQENTEFQAPKIQEDIGTASVTKSNEVDGDDATALTVASSVSYLTTPATTKSTKKVKFGSLTIRSHAVELGGAGVPGCGPAITLGWAPDSQITFPLETYEDARPCLPRRGIEMLLPRKQRVDMMLASGYTLNQIRLCSKECEETRKQRAQTVQRLSFADRAKSKLKKLAVWKRIRNVNNE